MNRLGEVVAAQTALAEELPLVHTSRCELLPSFIAQHEIQPTDCPVFCESLVYLFYGRPAYRSSRGTQPGESIALCPVCFVFKPRTISKTFARLYPLDTGAAAANRFQPHIGSSDLPNLELEPQIESARKAVPLFFGTNTNYFYGRALTSQTFPSGTTTCRFHQLLLQTGAAGYDDRRSVMEVSRRSPVPLRDTLSSVILPKEFLDDAEIRRAIIEEWNCDPCHYNTIFGASPAEYYSVVRQKIEESLIRATRI